MDKQAYKEVIGGYISEISELKNKIKQLELRVNTTGAPTDGYEVGSPEDYGEAPIIYESPDGGKTIYQRRAGDYENRKEVNGGGEQMELFKK